MDCMEGMKGFPDKYFDLAIVDPPYDINWGGTGFKKKNILERNLVKLHNWDEKQPDINYFNELMRVSKNQIIWGGNYFLNILGNCKSPLIWNKKTGDNSFADGEFAWTSFDGTMRIFTHQWCGAFKDSERDENIIHPTQKPIALYKWTLRKRARPDMKIIDTHVGSGSSIIAFVDFGCDWIGFEIDPDYHKAATERIERHKQQLKLF